jgi:membrane fusion protein (multidrug efflux system)
MSNTAVLPDEESSEDFGTSLDKRTGKAAPRAEQGRPDSMDQDVETKDARPFYRKPVFLVFITVVLILGIVGTLYWLEARHFEETDDANVDGHIVPINPQIAAIVAAVNIRDNQLVHQGDVLVVLDKTDYQIALNQARGAEAAAKGKVEQARSGIASSKAAVMQAQAELESAQTSFETADRDLKRYEGLDERSRSRQQEDDAMSSQKTAAAAVAQAKAKLESAQSQVASAKANVTAAEGDYEKAQADTKKAEVNLGYCTIVAPTDGRITEKNVEPGMYVTASTPLFELVPSDVWVIANFKETQLTHMQPGQPVTISVDAYPDRELNGTVDSIQSGTGSRFSVIPAENATGNFVKVVQRVPVKITFKGDANTDANHLLSPGMSVEAKVRVLEQ